MTRSRSIFSGLDLESKVKQDIPEREQIIILIPKINPYDNTDEIDKLNIEFFVKENKEDNSAAVVNNSDPQSSSANNANKTVSFNDNVQTVEGPTLPNSPLVQTANAATDAGLYNDYGASGGA
eukprot:CAMPEP_0176369862 /NCGR_PEP_ID=MMETSP0126-20121128/23584_1 /TAXON_ID=141414 ORGANISM="Strombidinopsis acuminatum, Strain SPMC142" /NCGR_SAMPLE_ID=MMETSP0126 /ASSEMBLY_ACC=CAM_ASM_000229 /LENGTH=122 /DNA_ID=CAMNT_0017728667 /DNA_START=4234 /DNA_END=4601 /DNA_ORIENTATION=-